MADLRIRCKVDSFIAVINLTSQDCTFKLGDRHVFNLKFIQKYDCFIRQDDVESSPHDIGINDQKFLKMIKLITIYAWL